MKILSINVSYGIGSTGKIVESLHNRFLELGHDSYVLAGRKTNILSNNVVKLTSEIESKIWHFFSKFTGNLYCVCPIATNKIIKFIKTTKPDVVHLHCLNGFFVNIPKLMKFLKKENINTVLTNHAEFMYTGNCGYTMECNNWICNKCKNCKRVKEFNGKYSLNLTHRYYKKMFNSISSFNNLKVTSVSPWLDARVKQSEMFGKITANCFTVFNPVTIKNLRKENIFKNDTKNVLYVTADFTNPEKGGFNLFKLAKECEGSNIIFYVKSGRPVHQKFKFKNLVFIDDLNCDLFSLYKSADCSLVLSQKETFSMVVAESLMCGTPIVGFKAGGPETIAINNYSDFVDFGDIKQLKDALLKMLNKKLDRDSIKDAARIKYSIETIANDYLNVYEK